jgi:hypothetical protein
MDVLLADELIAKPVPNPHRQHSIPGGLVQNKKFNKKAPPVDFWAGLLAKERENWSVPDWVGMLCRGQISASVNGRASRELHATLLKDQRFFVTTEVDLFERFGAAVSFVNALLARGLADQLASEPVFCAPESSRIDSASCLVLSGGLSETSSRIASIRFSTSILN